MYKKHKIVMLPSNDKQTENGICLGSTGFSKNKLYVYQHNDHWDMVQQHLYILSYDNINEGDWYLHKQSGILRTSNSNAIPIDAKKIIATTNKSLLTEIDCPDCIEGCEVFHAICLPSIPEYFIKHFIEQYNTGNVIQEVEVLYEEFLTPGWTPTYNNPDNHNCEVCAEPDERLTLDNNNIFIRCEAALQVEKVYSRTEVIELLSKYRDDALCPHCDDASLTDEQHQFWIEQNLK